AGGGGGGGQGAGRRGGGVLGCGGGRGRAQPFCGAGLAGQVAPAGPAGGGYDLCAVGRRARTSGALARGRARDRVFGRARMTTLTTPPTSAALTAASALTEAALAEQLLAASVDGLLAFDREYRYIFWNPAMERISGLQAADVLGRSAFDVLPFLRETGEDECLYQAVRGQARSSSDRPFAVP